jgi:hypothetical protein
MYIWHISGREALNLDQSALEAVNHHLKAPNHVLLGHCAIDDLLVLEDAIETQRCLNKFLGFRTCNKPA